MIQSNHFIPIILSRANLTNEDIFVLKKIGIDNFQNYNLKEGRNAPIKMLWELARLRASLVTIYGSVSELRLFGAFLSFISLFVRSQRRIVIMDGKEQEAIHFGKTIVGLLKIGWASITGFFAASLGGLRALYYTLFPKTRDHLSYDLNHHILYLKSDLWVGVKTGGSVGHVAGVVNALSRLGHEVHIITYERNPLVNSAINQEVISCNESVGIPYENSLHRFSSFFLRAAKKFLRNNGDFSLLYQRYSLNDMTGIRLARKLNLPLIMEYNGSEVWGHQNWEKPLLFNRLSSLIEKANLINADLVVTVSEALRQEIIRRGVPPERVVFYPNCVDPAVFNPGHYNGEKRSIIRGRYNLSDEELVFTFVGTFGRWHGAEILAKAIVNLFESHLEWVRERKLHFLFVGNGPTFSQVQSTLNCYMDSRFISMLGITNPKETPDILAISDVLLSPHRGNQDGTPFFGSPTKLFEYMAMGKPIIASDLDQIGMICRGWKPGFDSYGNSDPSHFAVLVKPGDPTELSDAIRRVANLSVPERMQRGQEARKSVLDSFTWEHHARQILKGYESLSGLQI